MVVHYPPSPDSVRTAHRHHWPRAPWSSLPPASRYEVSVPLPLSQSTTLMSRKGGDQENLHQLILGLLPDVWEIYTHSLFRSVRFCPAKRVATLLVRPIALTGEEFGASENLCCCAYLSIIQDVPDPLSTKPRAITYPVAVKTLTAVQPKPNGIWMVWKTQSTALAFELFLHYLGLVKKFLMPTWATHLTAAGFHPASCCAVQLSRQNEARLAFFQAPGPLQRNV